MVRSFAQGGDQSPAGQDPFAARGAGPDKGDCLGGGDVVAGGEQSGGLWRRPTVSGARS